jgi:hypothetical protein
MELYEIVIGVVMAKRVLGVSIKILPVYERHRVLDGGCFRHNTILKIKTPPGPFGKSSGGLAPVM